MPAASNPDRQRRLLVFNCHEAWVYQLGCLGMPMDVVVGLKGRYKQTWDQQMRPLPAEARLAPLPAVLSCREPYYCIIAHNITDLLDVKTLQGPRLIVIHSTLDGRALEEGSTVPPEKMKAALHQYLDLVGGHAVSVSLLKGRSWGFTEDIVPFAADVDDYPPYSGHLAKGLRISNHIADRSRILMWPFHQQAFEGLPVQLVGHNPKTPGIEAAANWDHLKGMLQSHRFYIHTADPRLEDGYNMATLEAMAAGMPVLGNRHPGSPIEHGVSGFLSDEASELRSYALRLLEDRDLAVRMGQKARETLAARFPLSQFRQGFARSIEIARGKWPGRKTSF